MQVFTIGHPTRTMTDLLQLLTTHQVTALADVSGWNSRTRAAGWRANRGYNVRRGGLLKLSPLYDRRLAKIGGVEVTHILGKAHQKEHEYTRCARIVGGKLTYHELI